MIIRSRKLFGIELPHSFSPPILPYHRHHHCHRHPHDCHRRCHRHQDCFLKILFSFLHEVCWWSPPRSGEHSTDTPISLNFLHKTFNLASNEILESFQRNPFSTTLFGGREVLKSSGLTCNLLMNLRNMYLTSMTNMNLKKYVSDK